jgi:hypothetical protein
LFREAKFADTQRRVLTEWARRVRNAARGAATPATPKEDDMPNRAKE